MVYRLTEYEVWKKEFKKLDDDIDRFLIYFQKIKTCTCTIKECVHYERKRNKIFGVKIDELYDKKMRIGFSTFQKMSKIKITDSMQ